MNIVVPKAGVVQNLWGPDIPHGLYVEGGKAVLSPLLASAKNGCTRVLRMLELSAHRLFEPGQHSRPIGAAGMDFQLAFENDHRGLVHGYTPYLMDLGN